MAYVYHEYVDGFRCFRVKIKSYGNFEHCLTFHNLSLSMEFRCVILYTKLSLYCLTATGTV